MAILDQSQVAGSTLGYAQSTTAFTTASTSPVQITGVSVTVTVPSGGRRVKITFSCRSVYNSNASAYTTISLWSGTVGTGTLLSESVSESTIVNGETPMSLIYSHVPAAGSRTYNVGMAANIGTSNITVGGLPTPISILVELI